MTSTHPTAAAASAIAADHPGVDKLFALLAYGEVAAFYRLTDEARMAPNMRGRIAMASMAGAEMRHFEMLHDALAARGIDVEHAMTGYVAALENYHRLTTPSTWLEALVKTYCPTRSPTWCGRCCRRLVTRSSWWPRCGPRWPPAAGSATG
jgi:tRNA isopentenyl-2-thiomethyl-A-37 hydroxylase MiaE